MENVGVTLEIVILVRLFSGKYQSVYGSYIDAMVSVYGNRKKG
jgi:hypothetical protein